MYSAHAGKTLKTLQKEYRHKVSKSLKTGNVMEDFYQKKKKKLPNYALNFPSPQRNNLEKYNNREKYQNQKLKEL